MTGAGSHPPTSAFSLDRSLQTLASRAEAWADLPLGERIRHLRTLLRRTGEVGPDLVAAADRAKGGGGRFAGEDWLGGVVIQARSLRALLATLEGIRRTGRVPVRPADVSTRPDGRVVLRVTPMDRWDRALYAGWRGEIWMDSSVGIDDLDEHLGSFYTKGGRAEPGVAAVLGAGNVASIAPLDVVHQLFVEGKATLLKLNPVNDYLGPLVERVFEELIDEGFVRTAYGGPDTGFALAHHPGVDAVHVTGSAATHDAIVFGPGPEGAERKRRGETLLQKRITSELGNVSPLIVVPGAWSPREMRFQAHHVATQITQNEGFNCNATKVIVLHRAWAQKEQFLDALRTVLGTLAPRPAYYPGAEERWLSFLASGAEVVGPVGKGILPVALATGVDPDEGHPAFTEEAFCTAVVVTELGGAGPAGFLEEAVDFANRRLAGTLNVTVLADPRTLAALGEEAGEAVAALRYGAVGVNVWAAASYALGITVWGGYPGATVGDIGSGIGFVHNGRLVDRPHKSVVWAPFVQVPRPPWFVSHPNTHRALRRLAEFEVEPGVGRLARVVLASLRR